MTFGIIMKKIRIGLIGCGTVGTGVVACIKNNAALIAARCDVQLSIVAIAVSDIEKKRDFDATSVVFTDNADTVVNSPDIDVIVELIGGTTDAKRYVLQALKNGKPVVTANKSLLAYHGDELFRVAAENGVDIYYEASVAGGVPIIKSLREGLSANHVERIYGILNGTCNYILTRMENDGVDFGDVLREAQDLGFAEADPSLDIDGHDTAHKTCILASLAYGEWIDVDQIFVEGIRGIDLQDIRNAARAGYKIKLLGIVKFDSSNIQMRVHPTLVSADSLLAKVSDEFNAVWVEGDIVGPTMLYGRGAGQDATASAVVADLVDVALNICFNSSRRVPPFRPHNSYNDVLSMDEIECRYYIRLSVDDVPNVMARIAQILGESGISIASVTQQELASDHLPIILITHTAKEVELNRALSKIEVLDVVREAPVVLRIEDIENDRDR